MAFGTKPSNFKLVLLHYFRRPITGLEGGSCNSPKTAMLSPPGFLISFSQLGFQLLAAQTLPAISVLTSNIRENTNDAFSKKVEW